ncbi:MAG: bifunctional oligoribonuclease/PAP phosphatase NrnA [Chthoniobacterales bacterium]
MSTASFDQIRAALEGAETIVVAGHLRPDGDALGSTIAFALWLKSIGKKVIALNENGVPSKYAFLPSSDLVTEPPKDGDRIRCDAFVALDTSVKERLGNVLDRVEMPEVFINIDHHVSNEAFGQLNFIDAESPATGQIVVNFFESQGIEITPAMAANLFVAISTDTGSFQYMNTTAQTFEAGATLVRAGVKVGEISQSMYEQQPRRRLELLRLALNSAEFTCDDRVASFALRRADFVRLGLSPEDNEGIIDQLRSVEGVIAAVFLEELGDGMIRISARSKDVRVDVCKVCGQFGGGGHALASGARARGDLDEVSAKFLEAICNEVGNVN